MKTKILNKQRTSAFRTSASSSLNTAPLIHFMPAQLLNSFPFLRKKYSNFERKFRKEINLCYFTYTTQPYPKLGTWSSHNQNRCSMKIETAYVLYSSLDQSKHAQIYCRSSCNVYIACMILNVVEWYEFSLSVRSPLASDSIEIDMLLLNIKKNEFILLFRGIYNAAFPLVFTNQAFQINWVVINDYYRFYILYRMSFNE